jgi:hypothetical protein
MDQLLRTAREQLRDRRSGLDRQHALVRVERRALVKVK